MAKSIFGAPPTDELSLILDARRYVHQFDGRVPTTAELRDIAKSRGNDLAAAIFSESIRASAPHAQFIRDVDAIDIDVPVANQFGDPPTLILVPALGYKRYRYAGGDGGMLLESARSLGMRTILVHTDCRASIDENAMALAKTLDEVSSGSVWIASISKGSLEVRRFLETRPDLIREKRVVGWLSICGMPNGVSVIERLRARLSEPFFRLSAYLAGMPIDLVREMCSDHSFWRRGLIIPNEVSVINVVAVPLLWHMQRSGIIRRYRMLADWGPNDGTVLIGDSPTRPGLIYPVWGADHYMRVPGMSFLIHKILRYALTIEPKPMPSQNPDQNLIRQTLD